MNNKIFELFLRLKNLYIEMYGTEGLYEKQEFESVPHRWATAVNSKDASYEDVLKYVQVSSYNNLCLFKYRPYNVVFTNVDPREFWNVHDQIYRYCRGVTIDIVNDKLVCNGFDKFFNVGEVPETSVEEIVKRIGTAKRVEVTNKLDGSLQMARWYDNKVVLTGSTGIAPEESYRVRNGTAYINNNENYYNMLKNNPDWCFVFEYIMEDDPHVVMYDYENEAGLYLLGIRDMNTDRVFDYCEVFDIAKKYGVLTTTAENYSFEDLLSIRDDFHCGDKEGWVLNIDGFRAKLKCTEFTQFHTAVSAVRFNSNRLGNAILKALENDCLDDLMASMRGKYRNEAEATLDTIKKFICYHDENCKYYLEQGKEHSSSVREFAIWANQNVPKEWVGYTMNMFRGVKSDYLKGLKFSHIRSFVEDYESDGDFE